MNKIIIPIILSLLIIPVAYGYYQYAWNDNTAMWDLVVGFFDGEFFQIDASINVSGDINVEGNMTSSTDCVNVFFEDTSPNENKNTLVVEGC